MFVFAKKQILMQHPNNEEEKMTAKRKISAINSNKSSEHLPQANQKYKTMKLDNCQLFVLSKIRR